MQLNGNQASMRSDAISAQMGSGIAGEIDIYDELVAFAEMSAEEQSRYLHPVEPAAKNISETKIGNNATNDSIDSGTAEPAEGTLELIAIDRNSNPTKEPVATGCGFVDVFGTTGPLSDLGLDGDFDGAESEEIVELFESGSVFADLDTDPHDAQSSENEAVFRGSGPFADRDLDSEAHSNESLRICPACEAELGADELFCAECGGFLNGISSDSPASSESISCSECTQSISTDEIFCPWCGSVLAEAS
jgi:RNA polymerase subunit RPABC4/transcription elongation factor Spt4